jgi:hypothetical protein
VNLAQVRLFWFLAEQVRMFHGCASVRIALHADARNELY